MQGCTTCISYDLQKVVCSLQKMMQTCHKVATATLHCCKVVINPLLQSCLAARLLQPCRNAKLQPCGKFASSFARSTQLCEDHNTSCTTLHDGWKVATYIPLVNLTPIYCQDFTQNLNDYIFSEVCIMNIKCMI